MLAAGVLVVLEGAAFARRLRTGAVFRKAESDMISGMLIVRTLGSFAVLMSIAFVCYHLDLLSVAPYLLIVVRSAFDVLVAMRRRG